VLGGQNDHHRPGTLERIKYTTLNTFDWEIRLQFRRPARSGMAQALAAFHVALRTCFPSSPTSTSSFTLLSPILAPLTPWPCFRWRSRDPALSGLPTHSSSLSVCRRLPDPPITVATRLRHVGDFVGDSSARI